MMRCRRCAPSWIRGGWVLEVDVVSFSDTLDHGHLRRFLNRRVSDGVCRRVRAYWSKGS
jgi:RNA-directed DNA polymerase